MADYTGLAKAMAAGGATGAGMGALGGAPNGLPGMAAGAQSGLLSGATIPLLQRMMPNNPDAARLIGQGAWMPFPLNIPALGGGALMLMGAKPTPNDQLTGSEPSGGSY